MKAYEHGGHGIHFERLENLYTGMPDYCVANLGRLPAALFLHNAKPNATDVARWVAWPGEYQINFEDRIRADLAAEGTFGVMVTSYSRGAFWQRNITFLADSPATSRIAA